MEEKFLVLQYHQNDISYHKHCDYHKIQCSETYTSVKRFHLIFTILVAVVLLSDIMNINHCNNYSHDIP